MNTNTSSKVTKENVEPKRNVFFIDVTSKLPHYIDEKYFVNNEILIDNSTK